MVLVHGGHHGPWVWERLQSVLQQREWATDAVALPSAISDPDRAEPLPGMYDDARVVRAAIDAVDGPVIVVAHSQGGAPATEAIAGAANVVHAVFVAAYMLDVGEGVFQTHGIPRPPSLKGARSAINSDLNLPAAFYDGNPDNSETAEACSRLVPQSRRSDFETVTRAGWRTVPNSYVIPAADLSITGTVAERLAARAQTVYRCPGHHTPFYSHPNEFADVLSQLARPYAVAG
jgi:pimeloyl-ACP methyl ester carboxylesterase